MISLLKKYNIMSFCFIIVLGVIAWISQANFLVNWDVSWDLLVSERLLAGGNYTHNFFDINPPLIFYVYAPVIFISRFFPLSIALSLQLYLFVLALLSLCLCRPLMDRIFIKEPVFFSKVMLLILALIFLLVPGVYFAQREHLLVIFAFPYFLTVAYRLQNNSLNRLYAIGIGIFSVLGFALKPFFLIGFVLAECLVFFYTRKLFSWLRPEVITIMVCLTAYFGIILIGYPDYLSTVVPLAQRFYYAGVHSSWKNLIDIDPVYFCGLTGLFYATQYKKNAYKKLCNLLLLAIIGFLIAYGLQQTPWYYHALPAHAFALFLMSLLCGLLAIRHLQHLHWVGLVTALLFAGEISSLEGQYSSALLAQENQGPLTTFLQTHAAQKPVYFITAGVEHRAFPTIMNTRSIYASRFLHLFWIPAIVKNSQSPHPESLLSNAAKKDEITLNDMVADDIENNKVQFIFIDVSKHKSFFVANHFEYLPYLLQNKHFQTAFKSYQYLTTIKDDTHHYTLLDHCALYWSKNKDSVDPKKIKGDAVILIKKKKDLVAYYISNHHFLQYGGFLLKDSIQLTDQILSLFPEQPGEIKITKKNTPTFQPIIKQLTQGPTYKFDVYARQDTTSKLCVSCPD